MGSMDKYPIHLKIIKISRGRGRKFALKNKQIKKLDQVSDPEKEKAEILSLQLVITPV